MKNDLVELLEPIIALDRAVLRQYTKITKKWEDKRKSRYSLSNLINIPSTILTFYLGNPYHLAFFHGWNFFSDNVTKPYGRDFNVQESDLKVEDGNPHIKKVDRITRLPLFVTGSLFAGLGLYKVVSGLRNGDNQNLSDGLNYIINGFPFIGIASSQYVKDANPKLFDKEPAWKKAYSFLKNKLEGITENWQPSPQPVPEYAR